MVAEVEARTTGGAEAEAGAEQAEVGGVEPNLTGVAEAEGTEEAGEAAGADGWYGSPAVARKQSLLPATLNP